VRELLGRHGRTFADELGIDGAKNAPSPLYRLLCAWTLMSARIGSQIAAEAARNLAKHVGVDIVREVQVAWDELFPFVDRRALDAGARLKLRVGAGLAPHSDRSRRAPEASSSSSTRTSAATSHG
jgi:hypothetical protein